MSTMMKVAGGALLFAVMSSVAMAGPIFPKRTIDLTLDSYCDGMHLVVNPTFGTVTGNRTGCMSAAVGGSAVASVIGAKTIDGASLVFVTDNGAYFWLIRDNGTWTVNSGIDGSLINSGNWAVGTAPVDGGPSSTAK